jgi:hypothetical protein
VRKREIEAEQACMKRSLSQLNQELARLAAETEEDIRHAKTQARLNSGGFAPNIGVFSRAVFDKLVDHPDFIDRTKYGQTAPNPAMATRRIIAEILELEEVLVMDAVYNTAAEGATESNAFIGGLSAALFYRPRNAGLMTPSAGYQITQSYPVRAISRQCWKTYNDGVNCPYAAQGTRVSTGRTRT